MEYKKHKNMMFLNIYCIWINTHHFFFYNLLLFVCFLFIFRLVKLEHQEQLLMKQRKSTFLFLLSEMSSTHSLTERVHIFLTEIQNWHAYSKILLEEMLQQHCKSFQHILFIFFFLLLFLLFLLLQYFIFCIKDFYIFSLSDTTFYKDHLLFAEWV